MGKSGPIALLLVALCGPAPAAAPVQRLSCTHLSGAPMHDLTMVIDDSAKNLTVEPEDWFAPDPAMSPVEFKGDTIEWSYMRGGATLDRKTGILDWDDTGEYSYLEAIGHADPDDKEENYRGKMQCKVLGN